MAFLRFSPVPVFKADKSLVFLFLLLNFSPPAFVKPPSDDWNATNTHQWNQGQMEKWPRGDVLILKLNNGTVLRLKVH